MKSILLAMTMIFINSLASANDGKSGPFPLVYNTEYEISANDEKGDSFSLVFNWKNSPFWISGTAIVGGTTIASDITQGGIILSIPPLGVEYNVVSQSNTKINAGFGFGGFDPYYGITGADLIFTNTNNNQVIISFHPDQVILSPVPETEQWVMIFLGLPLIGWIVHRKQSLEI